MTAVRANNGSDLIVDFCHRPRRRSSDRYCTQRHGNGEVDASKAIMKRQVSFSEDVAIHNFQYPSRDEVSKRWHSKRDRHLFTQELRRDVQCIRFLLSTTPMEALEKEALYMCIGLEALLSAKVTRALKERKRGYVHSIVEMQDSLSEEQLAAYAASHSSQSRERAQKLAAGYLEILL
mmetsp:Transcript_14286/g.20285  ORF Transcript_14286/g.20285 Transcript_14286/m.20285 type:complete len:178 (-) Transcript_14286:135-668(-)